MKKFIPLLLIILTAFSFNPTAETITAENIETVIRAADSDTLAKFNKLSASKRNYIMEQLKNGNYSSKEELETAFAKLVDAMTKPHGGGTGSGGGGGGGTAQSRFDVYISNADGKVPQDGEPAKVKVEACGNGEPLVYTAAVYDAYGRVADVKAYKTYFGENDCFEFDTVFGANSEIKVFSFKDTDSLTPVGMPYSNSMNDLPMYYDSSESLAVTGNITEINADSFTLKCTERLDGANAPTVFDKTITVMFDGAESVIYKELRDIVFGLKRVGDVYTLEQTSVDNDILKISCEDIVEYSVSEMKTDKSGIESVYEFSPEMSVYADFEQRESAENALKNEIISAYVPDGTVKILHGVSCRAEKVISASGGYVVTEWENKFAFDGKAGAGDVAEIRGFRGSYTMRIIDGTAGTWTGAAFDTAYGKLRLLGGNEYIYSFLKEGLSYTVYPDTSNRVIIYMKSETETALIFGVTDNNDGMATLHTEHGTETYEANRITVNVPCEFPCMMNIYRYEGGITLSPLDCIVKSETMRYDSAANSLGGYLLKDSTRIIAYLGNQAYNIRLKTNYSYKASLYTSFYGVDYVVVEVADLADICDMKLAVVAEVNETEIVLYTQNGIETMRNTELSWKKGDIIKMYSLDNVMRRAARIISPLNMSEGSTADMLAGRVCDITNRAVAVSADGTRYAASVSANTSVYIFDTEADTLTQASAGDIFCNPLNTADSDYVAIAKTGNAAQIIVVIKNN